MVKRIDFIRAHLDSNFGHSSNFWKGCAADLLSELDKYKAAMEKISRQPEDGRIDDSRTLNRIDHIVAETLGTKPPSVKL